MRFLPDERGQSIQIGAVLLFAVLIILLALWQAIVVPNQNEEVEFNHNEELQQQMTELRSTVNSMPDARTTRSVTLDLGVRYPSRSIFRNPPPVRGTFQTVGGPDGQLSAVIDNASAVDREGETGDFWNGSSRVYGTKSIQYRPAYNEYGNAPRTIYEHSVLFNKFDTEQQDLAVTGQALVSGERLTLIAVNGSLSESRIDSASVDFEPLSTETESVEVEPDGGPITLELPTRLSQGEWRTLFENVETVDLGNVTVNESAFPDNDDLGLLEVTLAETDDEGNPRTYTLRLAKIGLGTGTTTTEPAYLTDVAGNGSVIQRGQTRELTVQARDKFNRPLGDVTVTASAEGGVFSGGTNTTTTATGTNGEATLQYSGTVAGTNAINVSIDEGYQPVPDGGHNAVTPTNLTMEVTVERPPDTGSGGGAFNVSWDENTIRDRVDDQTGSVFEYDAAAGGELTLPMFTDPVADGAEVDYAVSDQLQASLSPTTGTTDADGRNSTTFEARRTGEVDVYTYSGGGGDRITIDVTDVSLGNLDISPTTANISATHNWSFNDVPFRGEVDNITASYPSGTSFTGVTAGDVSVFLTRAGESSPSEISVTSISSSGSEATFELDSSVNTDIDGPSWVEIDGLENPSAGNYTAALTFRGAEDELPVEQAFSIDKAGQTGFSETTVTDIVPNARGQMQTIEFTFDSEIQSGEQIEFIFDDAQSTSPLRVDYSSGSGQINDSSQSNPDPSVNGGTARATYTTQNTIPAGTTLQYRINGLRAGTAGDQQNPYTVQINRTDTPKPAEADFRVVPNSQRNPKIANLEISDIGSRGATQEITFTLTERMESLNGNAGEKISIDLTAPFLNGTEYNDTNSITSNVSSENIEILSNYNAGTGYANVNFESPSSGVIQAGEGIKITIDGLDSSLQDPQNGDTYESGVSRGTGGTVSDTFDVVPMANQINLVSASTSGGGDSIVDFTIENQGNADTEVTAISIDDTTSTNADNVNNGGGNEVEFSDNGQLNVGGGNSNIPIPSSELSLDATETVASGGQTTVTLQNFQSSGSGQSGGNVDMSGTTVDVTLRFADGSSQQFELNL